MAGTTGFIKDPDIRAIFENGEKNGTLEFLYTMTPGWTTYYVFRQKNGHNFWKDCKMTKTELTAAHGK